MLIDIWKCLKPIYGHSIKDIIVLNVHMIRLLCTYLSWPFNEYDIMLQKMMPIPSITLCGGCGGGGGGSDNKETIAPMFPIVLA